MAVDFPVAGSASIQRYFQVHRFDHELADRLREARGTQAEPYTGVAELWFARPSKSDPTSEGAAADRIIKADERKFIDLQRSAVQFSLRVAESPLDLLLLDRLVQFCRVDGRV